MVRYNKAHQDIDVITALEIIQEQLCAGSHLAMETIGLKIYVHCSMLDRFTCAKEHLAMQAIGEYLAFITAHMPTHSEQEFPQDQFRQDVDDEHTPARLTCSRFPEGCPLPRDDTDQYLLFNQNVAFEELDYKYTHVHSIRAMGTAWPEALQLLSRNTAVGAPGVVLRGPIKVHPADQYRSFHHFICNPEGRLPGQDFDPNVNFKVLFDQGPTLEVFKAVNIHLLRECTGQLPAHRTQGHEVFRYVPALRDMVCVVACGQPDSPQIPQTTHLKASTSSIRLQNPWFATPLDRLYMGMPAPDGPDRAFLDSRYKEIDIQPGWLFELLMVYMRAFMLLGALPLECARPDYREQWTQCYIQQRPFVYQAFVPKPFERDKALEPHVVTDFQIFKDLANQMQMAGLTDATLRRVLDTAEPPGGLLRGRDRSVSPAAQRRPGKGRRIDEEDEDERQPQMRRSDEFDIT